LSAKFNNGALPDTAEQKQ